ncbi:hypothetical protein ILUMI_14581 [Ignelater luminosus]|uniref:Uncharacterized protein n=1 Tax=Ignelater luminosus TaxID=2038154 RepID=A0A8K0CWA6_IGNLU|nr:hypothetical protein ILUMI_14581 [Ignelater luminosus]
MDADKRTEKKIAGKGNKEPEKDCGTKTDRQIWTLNENGPKEGNKKNMEDGKTKKRWKRQATTKAERRHRKIFSRAETRPERGSNTRKRDS